jgi:hypothetical protein
MSEASTLARTMAARHALLLAGSLWEATRFFIVLSLLAQLYFAAGAAGPGIVPWLLIGGSGNVLVAVGGVMLSLFPLKYAELIGFLRLGKVLSVFSFLLLGASGAVGLSAREATFSLGPLSLTQGSVLFVIFVLDLMFLAVLLAWRPEKPSA